MKMVEKKNTMVFGSIFQSLVCFCEKKHRNKSTYSRSDPVQCSRSKLTLNGWVSVNMPLPKLQLNKTHLTFLRGTSLHSTASADLETNNYCSPL